MEIEDKDLILALFKKLHEICGYKKFVYYVPNDSIFISNGFQKEFTKEQKQYIKDKLKNIDIKHKLINFEKIDQHINVFKSTKDKNDIFLLINNKNKNISGKNNKIVWQMIDNLFDKINYQSLYKECLNEKKSDEELFVLRSFQNERKYERMLNILEVISDISSELDFNKATDIVIRSLRKLYTFEGYTLILVDNETQTYKYHSYYFPFDITPELKKLVESEYPINPSGGRIAQAIKENRYFYFADVNKIKIQDNLNKKASDLLKIRSVLVIPFGGDDEVFGVIAIYGHKNTLKFSHDDISIIKNFFDQIATVFRNAYFYTTLDKKNREVEKVYRVIKKINDTQSFDEILNFIMDELKDLYAFEGFFLTVVDNERDIYKFYSLNIPFNIDEKIMAFINKFYPLNDSNSFINSVITNNKELFIKDSNNVSPDNDIDREIIEYFKIKSCFFIPLASANEVFGVIALTSHHSQIELEKIDISHIKGFLSQIATAFKGSFYSRLAMEKKRELEKINEFNKKINSSLDLIEILNYIIDYLTDRYRFEGHVISIKNENQEDKLDILYIKIDTLGNSYIDLIKSQGVPLKSNSNLIATTFNQNRVTYVNDSRIDKINDAVKQSMITMGIRSTINIPITAQKAPIGVLTFYTFNENKMDLTDEDINNLHIYSTHISAAIRNSILYKKVQEHKNAIEKEKDFTNRILVFSPIAIATINSEGNFLQVNPSFEHILDIKEEDLINRNFFELDVIKDNKLDEIIRSVYEGIGVKEEKFEFKLNTDNRKYILTIMATPIFYGIKVDNIMIMLIDTTELAKKEKELELRNKIIENDLILARSIQQNLLPKKSPVCEGFNFFSKYIPMEQLGGDFFDYIHIDENHLGILLSDVSGHGVSAAFITSMIKSNIEMDKETLLSPQEFFEKLQARMLPLLSDKYFTAIYGVLDIKNKIFKYSNAAHVPQLILKNVKNKVEQIKLPSNFIGLFIDDDQQFETKTLKLENRDKLILFTDGFLDNFQNIHDDNYNDLSVTYKKLEKIVLKHKKLKGNDFLNQLVEEAKSANNKKDFTDDIAIILIEIL